MIPTVPVIFPLLAGQLIDIPLTSVRPLIRPPSEPRRIEVNLIVRTAALVSNLRLSHTTVAVARVLIPIFANRILILQLPHWQSL